MDGKTENVTVCSYGGGHVGGGLVGGRMGVERFLEVGAAVRDTGGYELWGCVGEMGLMNGPACD